MNNKVKFLQIVMADLISQRDTLEIDLNIILNNNTYESTKIKKKDFDNVLTQLTETNNKITVMSDYLTQVNTPTPDKMETENV
jgi:hypothetical protein